MCTCVYPCVNHPGTPDYCRHWAKQLKASRVERHPKPGEKEPTKAMRLAPHQVPPPCVGVWVSRRVWPRGAGHFSGHVCVSLCTALGSRLTAHMSRHVPRHDHMTRFFLVGRSLLSPASARGISGGSTITVGREGDALRANQLAAFGGCHAHAARRALPRVNVRTPLQCSVVHMCM